MPFRNRCLGTRLDIVNRLEPSHSLEYYIFDVCLSVNYNSHLFVS